MRITGLGSGMDIDYMVKEMMTAERIPMDKLSQKKIWTEWQQQAYRESNLSLSNFRTAFESLRFSRSFNAYSATISGGAATATATSTTVPGTYSIDVQSLASSAKMHSASSLVEGDGSASTGASPLGIDGKVTIEDSAGEIVEINLVATDKLSDVASKIQTATAGTTTELRAGFDATTSRFFISTKGMGENQNFTMKFDSTALGQRLMGGAGTDVSTTSGGANVTAATDGSFLYDGIPVTGLTENKATINGLNIELKSIGNSTVSISTDTEAPFQTIKKAIESYNEMIEKFEKQVVEKHYKDFPPLTDDQRKELSESEIKLWDEKARSGLLRSDPILRETLTNLRRAFADPVEGLPAGSLNTLSAIGITTGNFREGGKLNIDEAKLRQALAEKPDEVMQLFTKKTAGQGVAERVYTELNDSIRKLSNKAGAPTALNDNSTLTQRLKQMDTQIKTWQSRLVSIEDRYWKQFSAMEKAMNQMNQQSSWIQQNMMGGM
ncbi:flagellar filament capping protein FliD [Chryseomicrobium palamuruense]|uniref:Flagellar hook-associated protein 2 n=1 Tax=Chryseomicrobium palamuruense TaxID=682973 RepID=A0ABV8UVD4_9BACL